MADVNANINVNINSSAALAGLKRLEQQIESFQRSVTGSNAAAAAQQTSLNRALIQGINNTGLFTAKQISAVDSVGKFTNSLEKNKLSLGEYTRFAGSQLPGLSKVFKKEFDTMQAVAVDRVKSINTQYLALGRTVDGVTSAIKSTPTGLSKGYATNLAVTTARQQMFNKLIDDGSTKLLNWGKNTQWAGRQLMVGLSLPLAAFGAAASAAFMELDKATVQLKRVYGDLDTTTAEVERNTEAVKVLGSEYTKYGISVAETIGISARAAATGATNETLMTATEQTLRFATLGQIDYNQALDTTISLQTAFGITNEELASKIDFLNAVENQTILTIEDMSMAIPRVATVVRGLGGDVEDLAVMMTAMREGGVTAENAANGLKSGLASLINPTKRAREQMAKMGLDMQGIINANKGDLMGLINEFGSAINGLDDFSRQQTLEQVFGKYQFARMSALFTNITKSSGQAARAMDLAAMSAEDLGRIAEGELSVISESTTVKFQAAFEQLKLTIAPIGEAFLKVATPAIEMVTKIANAFNELPEPIKNAIGMATIAIAGIGPVLLMGIGLMGNLIANVIKGIQQFRKLGARIRGDSSAFQYMAKAELEALAATEALEANTMSLTGKLQLQAGAVRALSTEYQRFAGAAGIASGAMGAFPAGRGAAGSKGKPRLKMARGGVVPGTGSGDTVPALLEPGETVLTKAASKQYAPIIAAMNAGTIKGFQEGLSPQSSRESLVFAHAQAPKDLADDIVDKIKKVAPGSKYLQQATSMQGLSNFGMITPEKFNQGKMSGTQAAKLFQDPAIVDRTMYPMYESIARSMGAKTPAQIKQIMNDPSIQKDVRSFANNIGTGLAKSGAKSIGDAQFYDVVEKSLAKTQMAEGSRSAIQGSRNTTTVAAYGGGIRSKGERVSLGQGRQQQVFGASGGVSYKSTSMIKKAGLVLGAKFGQAVRSSLRIKSPSEDAKEVVREYVDGMEVGAAQNSKDAAKAGTLTGKAYSGAVSQSVSSTAGRQMTKDQYRSSQSQRRRDARNIDVMYAGGMTDDTQILRTLRRQKDAEEKAQRVKAAQQRKQSQATLAEQKRLAKEQIILAEKQRRIQEVNDEKASRRAQRRQKVSRGVGRAGGVIGMASMIPFMAQNSEGKFAGMDANMLGMGMMGASMAQPLASGIGSGITALSGALGISAVALGAVAAGALAVGGGLFAVNAHMNSVTAEAMKLADAMSVSAKSIDSTAEFYGNRTFAQRQKEISLKEKGVTSQEAVQATEYLATEVGKSLQEQTTLAIEKLGAGKAVQGLAQKMSSMIVSGAITRKQAESVVTMLGEQIGNEQFAINVRGTMKELLGPDGKDLKKNPYEVAIRLITDQENIQEAFGTNLQDSISKAIDVGQLSGFFTQGVSSDGFFSTDSMGALTANIIGFGTTTTTAFQDIAYVSDIARNVLGFFNQDMENAISAARTYGTTIGNDVRNSYDILNATIERNQQLLEKADKKDKPELRKRFLQEENDLREKIAESVQKQKDAFSGMEEGFQVEALRGVRESILSLYENDPVLKSIVENVLQKTDAVDKDVRFNIEMALSSGLLNPMAVNAIFGMVGDDKRASIQIDTIINSSGAASANDLFTQLATLENKDFAAKIQVESVGLTGKDVEAVTQGLKFINSLPPEIVKSLRMETWGVFDVMQASWVYDDLADLPTPVTKKAIINAIGEEEARGLLAAWALFDSLPESTTKTARYVSVQEYYTLYKEVGFDAKGNPIQGPGLGHQGDLILGGEYVLPDVVKPTTTEGDDPLDPPVDDPKGGSEKEKNAMQEMQSMILKQLKMYSDAQITLKQLMNKKNSFFKLLNMNKGIDDKIRAAGLSPAMTDYLMNLEPKQAGQILNKITNKGGKLNTRGIRLEEGMLAGQIGQTMNAAQTRVGEARSQQRATASLASRGAGADAISAIGGDPAMAQQYIFMLDKAGVAQQRYLKVSEKLSKGGLTKKEKERVSALKKEWDLAEKSLNNYIDLASDAVIAEQAAAKNVELAVQKKQTGVTLGILAEGAARGIGPDALQEIASDPSWAAKYQDIQKRMLSPNAGIAAAATAEYNSFYQEIQTSILATEAIANAADPIGAAINKLDKARDPILRSFNLMEAQFKKQFGELDRQYAPAIKGSRDVIKSYEKQIQTIDDEIKTLERRNQEDQNRVRDLNRQKEMLDRQIQASDRQTELDQRRVDALNRQTEMINRQIEAVERQNEMDQRIIENLQREDELRNRVSDSLGQELELMSRQEDRVREVYDKRIQALDEIEKINSRISQQQQDQLDLAQSLGQGDIFAAARAAQQMRDNQIADAKERQREALQQGMENQIGGMRTSGGLSREQAEQQIQTIQDQSYQTQLMVRDVEDAIYNRNLALVPVKDQIRAIDDQVRVITDLIYERNLSLIPVKDEILTIDQSILAIQDTVYARETEILNIQVSRLQPLKDKLDLEQRNLTKQEEALENAKANVRINGLSYDELQNRMAAESELYELQKSQAEAQIGNNAQITKSVYDIMNAWNQVIRAIEIANSAAKNKTENAVRAYRAELEKIQKLRDSGKIKKSEASARIQSAQNVRNSAIAQAEAERSAAVASAQARGSAAIGGYNRGGTVRGYSAGLVSGAGARDSVMAMLTPGEVVIRKSMVDKYGLAMLSDINTGAFSMPEYSVTKPVAVSASSAKANVAESSPSVYNTYSVNVNVPNANINADEVANKVLYKIRSIDAGAVRGYRGF